MLDLSPARILDARGTALPLGKRPLIMAVINVTPDSFFEESRHPGIGFGKTLEQNLAILARLEEIVRLGFPILLGVSRKSFIGKLVPSSPGERLPATIAANIIGALAGVSIIRVHDVAAHAQALKIAEAIRGTCSCRERSRS